MCAGFPNAHFPGWWDIHNHKANHLSRFPNARAPFGTGRSMVADWGRVGSCQLLLSGDGVDTHSQISFDLAGVIHREECPKPLLPVHYLHIEEPNYPLYKSFPKGLFKDLRNSHLLYDSVFGEQTCATFLCAKFITFLSQNLPSLPCLDKNCTKTNDELDAVDSTCKFLKFVEESTSEALSTGCRPDALRKMLREMVEAVVAIDKECVDEEAVPKKRQRLGHSNKSLRKKKQLVLPSALRHMFRIPSNDLESSDVSEYLGLNRKASVQTSSDVQCLAKLSSAIDPFIVALSARRVNPDFLGCGCLRLIGEESPLMLWAPPSPGGTATKFAPKIYVTQLFDSASFPLSSNQYTFFQPTDDSVSPVCEIDAFQLDECSFYSVIRNSSGQVFTTKTRLKFSDEESIVCEKCKSMKSGPCDAYYRPASVAICPWRIGSHWSSASSLSWAVAGRTYNSVAFPDAHLAVVELFDAQVNRRSWCGRVPLNIEGESITQVLANSVASSSLEFVDGKYAEFEEKNKSYANSFLYNSLLDYCQQVRKKQEGENFLSPRQLLYGAELDFQLSHASTWVRVGFADAPGLLSLTTPKRLLVLDTRDSERHAAQELFNMTVQMVDLDKGRSFNPYESIFHAQPRWYGDTYALLATDYSGLVLDKRMPGHPVLHWSHALRSPLTYAEICDMGDQPGDFPAQVAVVTASQLPGEISIMGINFNRATTLPPSVVGPCMTVGTLTDILDCSLNNLPSGILDPNLCNNRLITGLVGSTACILRDQNGNKPIGIRGLLLTSKGDIFCEDWFFSESRAIESHRAHADDIRSWCLGFQGPKKLKSAPFRMSGVIDEIIKEDVKIGQRSMETATEPLSIEDIICESKREFPDAKYPMELYSDIRQLLVSESVPTSLSSSREKEERMYYTFLDQIMIEANKKRKG